MEGNKAVIDSVFTLITTWLDAYVGSGTIGTDVNDYIATLTPGSTL